MTDVDVHVLHAFTDGGEGGNPAGVVLDAAGFSDDEKQAIAAEVGLSETVFISPSQTADVRLDFFTPTRRVSDCGHATVAAFTLLHERGLLPAANTSKEITTGRREVRIEDGEVFMQQRAPRFETVEGGADILAALSLSDDQLLAGKRPIIADTGEPFLLVPLATEADVHGVRPDQAALRALSVRLGVIGFHVFSPETRVNGRAAGVRMFAPAYGIDEESATGMAAGALGAFLDQYIGLGRDSLVLEQGHLMTPPSPSRLVVRLTRGGHAITDVWVGGRAVTRGRRTIALKRLAASMT